MKNIEKLYLTTLDTNKQELNKDTFSLTSSKAHISIAFSADVPYIHSEPIYVIFVEVLEKANKLSDVNVKRQTVVALYTIIHCLQAKSVLSRRLPKPSLTENDDGSSLLEWNFEKFRIGLYFEQDESKSFYFFVQRDDSIGFSDSQTRRINGEIKSVVFSLINFVIDNT